MREVEYLRSDAGRPLTEADDLRNKIAVLEVKLAEAKADLGAATGPPDFTNQRVAVLSANCDALRMLLSDTNRKLDSVRAERANIQNLGIVSGELITLREAEIARLTKRCETARPWVKDSTYWDEVYEINRCKECDTDTSIPCLPKCPRRIWLEDNP